MVYKLNTSTFRTVSKELAHDAADHQFRSILWLIKDDLVQVILKNVRGSLN